MKIMGIGGVVLFLFGGLVFIIGLIVCLNTWNSDYATKACSQAELDREKFDQAKEMCGTVTSDCYKQATIGLVSADECKEKTDFMSKQMMMGAIPAVIGFILGFVGLLMAILGFVLGRKKSKVAIS